MTRSSQLSSRALPALLLTGLLAALAGCGIAQSSPSGDSNYSGHSGHGGRNAAASPMREGMHESMRGHDPARMQAQMNQRMAELKTKLAITPAQETAWTAFTTAMQPPYSAGYAGMRANHEALSKLPTPERLDRMRDLHAQHMNEMNARMSQRADATKAFYSVLNDAQKKTFDDAFTRATGGRRGHHMMNGDERRS